MSTLSGFSMADRAAERFDAECWPVLARLPEIEERKSGRAPAAHAPHAARSTDYRFDPPQPRPYPGAGWREMDVKSAWRDSPALPRTNPFSIPASSLEDAIAPVVRFLILVALFTMAGTMILMIGKDKAVETSSGKAVTAAVKQSLQPTSIVLPTPFLRERSVAAPSASGTGSGRASSDKPEADDWPDFTELGSSTADDDVARAGSNEEVREFPDSSPWPHETRPHTSATPPSHTERIALPRVQTAEPPISVARLPDHVESPSGHASHDDNQPRLH